MVNTNNTRTKVPYPIAIVLPKGQITDEGGFTWCKLVGEGSDYVS